MNELLPPNQYFMVSSILGLQGAVHYRDKKSVFRELKAKGLKIVSITTHHKLQENSRGSPATQDDTNISQNAIIFPPNK